jgi:hypothetical protein
MRHIVDYLLTGLLYLPILDTLPFSVWGGGMFRRHFTRHRLAGQFGTVRTESEYTGRTCVVGFLIANSFRDFCVLYV